MLLKASYSLSFFFVREREKIQSKKSGLFTLKSKIRRRRMMKSLSYTNSIKLKKKAATHKKHVVKTRERGKEREREREREKERERERARTLGFSFTTTRKTRRRKRRTTTKARGKTLERREEEEEEEEEEEWRTRWNSISRTI